MSHLTTKLLTATAAALAVTGGATALAQTAPPAVDVTLGGRAATIEGADALPSGPTTLNLASRRGEQFALVLRLKPGVTVAEARRAVPRIRQPTAVRRFGTSVASGGARPGATYTTTVDLAPARYAIVTLGRRGAAVTGSFRVGDERGDAVAPAPDATIVMGDFSFRAPRELPREGVVRWENRGRQFHEAAVFRLRPGANARAVVRTLRQGGEPRRQDIAGVASGIGIVDRGTVNDVATRLQPGDYVLACFLPDERAGHDHSHAEHGMVRRVVVR